MTERRTHIHSQDLLLRLLAESGPRLHAMLLRLTLSVQAAEDLMQELFLKLAASDGLAGASSPEAYAFRSAIHLAFDWRRRQRRAPTTGLAFDPPAEQPGPPAELIRREEYLEVLDALEELAEPGRTVLVLRYIQENDYASIAEVVGSTPHRCRSIAAKALDRLRGAMRPGRSWNTANHIGE